LVLPITLSNFILFCDHLEKNINGLYQIFFLNIFILEKQTMQDTVVTKKSNSRPCDRDENNTYDLTNLSEESAIRICRYINTISPVLRNYTQASTTDPDDIKIYSIVDKLSFITMALHISSTGILADVITNANIVTNAEAINATRNLAEIFDGINKMNNDLRRVAFNIREKQIELSIHERQHELGLNR
jgi:hypothetical protein